MTLEEGRQGSSLVADNRYATPQWLVERDSVVADNSSRFWMAD
jgi:hypothetical protein